MGKNYRQLRYEDRIIICKEWKLGVPQASIARSIGVNRSTVSREVKRLCYFDKNTEYLILARRLHDEAMAIKSAGRSHCRTIDPQVWQIVKSKLKYERWSPEEIAGWLTREIPTLAVSHQSIYNYLRERCPDLIQYLKRKGNRRKYPSRKRRKLKVIESAASKKTSIKYRPEIINNRSEVGHWEVDLVGSTSSSTILVILERLTRYSILRKVIRKDAETVKQELFNALSPLPTQLRRSLTFDHGPENALHYQLNQELKTSSFFCEPFHAWEKGSIENRIGVLRIFFPKGTNFNFISYENVARVQWSLNYRPMKLLDFNFPAQLFNDYLLLYQLKCVA